MELISEQMGRDRTLEVFDFHFAFGKCLRSYLGETDAVRPVS